MMELGWVELDSREINEPKKLNENGGTVSVSIPSYDIPVALKVTSGGVICFRYKGKVNERFIKKILPHGITVKEGKLSGRIYELHIDAESLGLPLNTDSVALNLTLIAEETSGKENNLEEVLGFRAAAKAISAYAKVLVPAPAH